MDTKLTVEQGDGIGKLPGDWYCTDQEGVTIFIVPGHLKAAEEWARQLAHAVTNLQLWKGQVAR